MCYKLPHGCCITAHLFIDLNSLGLRTRRNIERRLDRLFSAIQNVHRQCFICLDPLPEEFGVYIPLHPNDYHVFAWDTPLGHSLLSYSQASNNSFRLPRATYSSEFILWNCFSLEIFLHVKWYKFKRPKNFNISSAYQCNTRNTIVDWGTFIQYSDSNCKEMLLCSKTQIFNYRAVTI